MKTNLFRFALTAAAMLLAGCTVSPMYEPPMEKDDIESEFPAAWEGCWERFDDENILTSFVLDREAGQPDHGKPVFLTQMVKQSAEGFSTLPLIVRPVRYGDERFFVVQADLRRMVESGRISSYGLFMLRPYYYLVKPEMPDKDTLKLSFVSWIEERDDKKIVPLDPAVKLEPGSAVVMNTTAELKALIAAKKYRLTEERIFRRRPAPAPAKP